MKKVLALVLAVMMLATVAFAEPLLNPGDGSRDYTNNAAPGTTIEITAQGIIDAASKLPTPITYKFVDSDYKDDGGKTLPIKDLNSTNYTITNLRVIDGKNLLDGNPKFNDASDKIEIKLKQDYDNTKGKTLVVEFKLKGKKVGKSTVPANIDIKVSKKVGYKLNTVTWDHDSGDTVDLPAKMEKDELIEFKAKKGDNDAPAYVTLAFTAEDDETDIETRVYDGDKKYFYNTVKVNKDIAKKYDNDLTFLNFPGEPEGNFTVRFYKEEGTYIYIYKDGKLSAVTANAATAGAAGQAAGSVKWDEDEGCYILKTRKLAPTYVFSDEALAIDEAAADTTPANPDTGANDVVGIATALAAVALVSAAAVSLKK